MLPDVTRRRTDPTDDAGWSLPWHPGPTIGLALWLLAIAVAVASQQLT
jgi:hypothetical protein